ncbi:MAG: hypothetical protein R6W89_06915, partial [Candidatus Hydrogenedentota bacterium]
MRSASRPAQRSGWVNACRAVGATPRASQAREIALVDAVFGTDAADFAAQAACRAAGLAASADLEARL